MIVGDLINTLRKSHDMIGYAELQKGTSPRKRAQEIDGQFWPFVFLRKVL